MTEYKSRAERRQAKQKDNDKQPKGKKGNKKGLFKRIVLIIFLVILFLVLAGVITVFAVIKQAPSLDPKLLKDPMSTTIYDKNGHKIDTVYSQQNRTYAPINKIPEVVQDAFISTEDNRFYKHFGIDPYRIGGAVVANITHGFGSEGGSTLDQQVIKNSLLTPKKTLTRKVQEAYLAIKLDQKYSKKQILEMYLNKIYLGEQAYGVGTAAKVYFGKNVKDLTLPEAAMLASLPKAPSYYDPLANPKAAKQREDLVLDTMAKNHYITQAQADKAKQVSIKEMTKDHKGLKTPKRKYTAYINYVYNELVNKKKVISKDEFYQGGLKIYTNLDPKAQQRVQDVLNNDGNFPGVKKNFQAGTALIDTKTGAIEAIGGGRHYQDGINWATSTDNAVGSTAKPIMDYGPAVEYENWSTAHRVVDEPYKYSNGHTLENWDGQYKGPMTIRDALAQSRNIPAVKTLHQLMGDLGQSKIKDFTNNLGFNFKNIYESYAIGSFTASPLQMAGAYAAFGNNGVYNEPYAVKSIEFPDGHTIDLDHKEHVAMHDYTAYMITDMLKSVIHDPQGTGRDANLPGVPVAGKTGSTNIPDDYARQHGISSYDQLHGDLDSWFVGYTTDLTMAVWTGYTPSNESDSGSFLPVSEQHYSQDIFKYVMEDLASPNTPDFKKPNSVVESDGELYVRGHQSDNVVAPKHDNQKEKKKQDQTQSSSSDQSSTDNNSSDSQNSSQNDDKAKQDNQNKQDQQDKNKKQDQQDKKDQQNKDNQNNDQNSGQNNDNSQNQGSQNNQDQGNDQKDNGKNNQGGQNDQGSQGQNNDNGNQNQGDQNNQGNTGNTGGQGNQDNSGNQDNQNDQNNTGHSGDQGNQGNNNPDKNNNGNNNGKPANSNENKGNTNSNSGDNQNKDNQPSQGN
ncbi:transglycosylase domain-containing protein [Scopulibacillus cellulosilyticus]|uniref:Transglycosylase domain-containing protein n=1 Tax=Scopulibacillus cellulosilyticus TaxID=2665665 RepID=A0ABW2PTC7_9BACL